MVPTEQLVWHVCACVCLSVYTDSNLLTPILSTRQLMFECQRHPELSKSPERNDFKIGVLVYRCLHGLAPLYLSDYFERIADTNRRRLRSSSSSLLAVRRTRLSTVGDRAFPVIGSRFWNTLPDSVSSAPSLSVFRSRLKSHLFERAFPADCY